jgi:hypothetical protein
MRKTSKNLIVEDFSEVLSEIAVDQSRFLVAWHPIEKDSCILWFTECIGSRPYEALGKFSRFDKKQLLIFVVRFLTECEFREEVLQRRFQAVVNGLSFAALAGLADMSYEAKIKAFKSICNIDNVMDSNELKWKKRILTKRFHPDAGGDHVAMTVVNEAFDHMLKSKSSARPG